MNSKFILRNSGFLLSFGLCGSDSKNLGNSRIPRLLRSLCSLAMTRILGNSKLAPAAAVTKTARTKPLATQIVRKLACKALGCPSQKPAKSAHELS
ncbi:hypothetical protein [Campylobacter sp.]|uniref:hypothetical protein n=1 Tax=Campylobacter sp. TaxID=205 RepID=UPI002AA948F9|nr:hypothetical protein [Campylobacter sp.]MCI6564344.1 hypothetical protein [Campylobacter sp.]MCI6579729.1 hypothetical protein [Campylobacter sp.]